jgi:flagellar protein FlgJ
VLAAQVSLETARGGQMFNFNFGGIKGASPRGETANYMTREVLDGQSVHLQQGFRAYSSLDEGAKDYVSVLRTRFPAAFAQAVAGNVDGFAHALKQSHYYTAPEQEYATGLRGAVGLPTTSPRVEPLQAVPQGFSTSAELSRILDAVSASATRIAAPEPLD